MKFTLSWLKEHLDTDASIETIAETLTDLGLEVEGIENPAARLGSFTLARVKHAEQHPDADRLRVCIVETDEGDKQIVCGAPNARAGITVVLAKPGDYVPGIDTTLGVGKIRGVESHGMMASERELELSDEHDGIIELPSGEVGQKFVDWLAQNDPARVDPVIEIAITPNRPDALGIAGIARDLAARGLGRLIPRAPAQISGGFASPVGVSIAPELRETGCPIFAGRVIRGVRNGPSPEWLQRRLRAIGLRPISALVDITNFFTYDQNRPLHVFDVARLTGDLRIHPALGGEVLMALDDREYTLDAGMMVISDDSGPVSIAGIMGGLATGCTHDTTDVFLESAYWDPVTIARTGRMLKINSDARYRFERGVDPAFTPVGLDMAAKMIVQLCGGEVSDVAVDGAVPDTSRALRLDPARVSSLVGMQIAPDEQRRILAALGFGATAGANGIEVWVPSWRPDVTGEADLVEEIARITSLTLLKGVPMARPAPGVARPVLTLAQRRASTLRRAVAATGYNECVTYSFIDQPAAALFGGGSDAVRLANPISSDMSHMRPDLLPGLLQAAARNQARGFADLALFELGQVFDGGEPGESRTALSGVRLGQTAPRNPFGTRRPVDLHDARADAEAALATIGAPVDRLMIQRSAPGWFHPGRSAVLSLGPKNPLAVFGELHPAVLRALDVKGPAVAFSLWPDAVPAPRTASRSRPALDVSDLQAVERDFAFVVGAEVEADTILRAAQGADKALIASVSVFDVFSGPKAEAQMGAGRKSVAIAVRLQPRQSTLTDQEIEAVSAKVIDKVTRATGGSLRGQG